MLFDYHKASDYLPSAFSQPHKEDAKVVINPAESFKRLIALIKRVLAVVSILIPILPIIAYIRYTALPQKERTGFWKGYFNWEFSKKDESPNLGKNSEPSTKQETEGNIRLGVKKPIIVTTFRLRDLTSDEKIKALEPAMTAELEAAIEWNFQEKHGHDREKQTEALEKLGKALEEITAFRKSLSDQGQDTFASIKEAFQDNKIKEIFEKRYAAVPQDQKENFRKCFRDENGSWRLPKTGRSIVNESQKKKGIRPSM